MHRRPLTGLATRALRRRLGPAPAVEEPARSGDADDARLDALRGELVRELDRLAASDQACSADFRRVA
ncbi:MAG: hypothetical protein ACJ760_14540 [Thermoleophilaceae bacterium]